MKKLLEALKKQQEEIANLNDRIGKYSETYCNGIKEGIAWAEENKEKKR